MSMFSPNQALLLIDIQNDFVQGGALAVPDGMEIIAIANRLMPRFNQVIATQDWHPHNHRSFASQNPGVALYSHFDLDGLPQTAWPDHCIQNTFGAELVDILDQKHIHHRVFKGTDRVIDSYSGFFDNGHRRSTGLSDLLRKHLINEVFVLGLATDYCVLYSVLDAIQEGFQTTVVTDACRGVGLNANDIPLAWSRMKQAGAQLIESSQL